VARTFRWIRVWPLSWLIDFEAFTKAAVAEYGITYIMKPIDGVARYLPWLWNATVADEQLVDGKPMDWADFYTLHNNKIERSMDRRNRLLKFNVKEGWGPLCAFLGKPVPEASFPSINESGGMERLEWFLMGFVVLWPFLVGASVAGVVWLVRKALFSSTRAPYKAKHA